MQRRSLLLFSVVSLMYGCATLVGPREAEIPKWKLQEALERKFPTNNRLLALFDIELSRPVLSLLPDKNRVEVSMDTSIAPMLLNRAWTGSFTVSGILEIAPSGEAVILAEPMVDNLTLDGESPAVLGQVRKVANFFIEQFLEDVPLYRFEPEKLSYAGVRMKPTGIVTHSDRIVVTFEPIR